MAKNSIKEKQQENLTVKVTFWVEKKIWEDFQKRTKSERTYASHKLMNFIEQYLEGTSVEDEYPLVTYRDLSIVLKELRTLVKANTRFVEMTDRAGDYLVILKQPLATHNPNPIEPTILPSQQGSGKTLGATKATLLIDKVLWNDFLVTAQIKGDNASRLLRVFIERYMGCYFDVAANKHTSQIAQDLASEMKQLRLLLAANTGTVVETTEKGRQIGIIRSPISNKKENTGRRSIPLRDIIHKPIDTIND